MSMDWNVEAAMDALGRVAPSNRPASASKLAMLLCRRGCSSVKVYSLVTPLELAKALVPLLEDSPALQLLVKTFADTANEEDASITDLAQEAAKRTVARLKFSETGSSFFVKQVLKERGLYLASQAYALLEVKPEALVVELVRRGIVIEDSAAGRLQYSDSLTWTEKPRAQKGSTQTESTETEGTQNTTATVEVDKTSAKQENKSWDWSFWGSSGVVALPENGSIDKPSFTVDGCSFPSSFFGHGGSFMAAFRQKFAAVGMRVELLLKENAVRFHYKGEPPPIEAVREIVLMIAGPTAPAICKHPARRGRIRGEMINSASLKHDVRLCRIKNVLHLWPTASLMTECKKSDLVGAVRSLRDAVERKRAEVDAEMRQAFDDLALDPRSAERYAAYAERKARRSQRQAAHIQKIGPGTGNRLLGAAHEFQKTDREFERQRDKLRKNERKEHLQDRDWRKRYGGKVNRDKKAPMHGGRHKAGEGAVDDEGVQKLSELARAPSVVEAGAGNTTTTTPSELKDILHEMAVLWCTVSSSKPTAEFDDLKSSLTHHQVRAWNDAVSEFGEIKPDAQSLAIKAYTLFRVSDRRDSLDEP